MGEILERLQIHIKTTGCLVALDDCPVGVAFNTRGEVLVRYSMSAPRFFASVSAAAEHINEWLAEAETTLPDEETEDNGA